MYNSRGERWKTGCNINFGNMHGKHMCTKFSDLLTGDQNKRVDEVHRVCVLSSE